jgi:hypothetical protein
VLDHIAPIALPRSSIIVSDEPLSRETNFPSEFVAVLSNQPQGAFLMRRHTVNVHVASPDEWSNDGFGLPFQRNRYSPRQRAGQSYQPMRQPY